MNKKFEVNWSINCNGSTDVYLSEFDNRVDWTIDKIVKRIESCIESDILMDSAYEADDDITEIAENILKEIKEIEYQKIMKLNQLRLFDESVS